MRYFLRYIHFYTKFFTRFFKKFFPDGLLWRALLILIAPVCIVQVTIITVFFEKHISEQIVTQSVDLANEIGIIRLLQEKYNFSDEAIADITGKVRAVYLMTDQPVDNRASKCLQNFITRKSKKILRNALGDGISICYYPLQDHYEINLPVKNRTLNVTVQKSALLGSKWHILLVWTGTVSIFAALVAILFMKNQIRPVRKLALAAEAFGKGDYQYRYFPSGASEVRLAGEAFIKMRDRVAAHIKQRTMLLAGVSHDLRTLLTRFSFGLSLFPLSEDDIKELKSDTRRMKEILNEYLKFAEISQSEAGILQEISPAEYLEKIVKNFHTENFQISFIPDQNLIAHTPITLEKQSFERCLINILDNAGKFADRADMKAEITGNYFMITVEDNGPGVEESFYQDIFKPFFKVDKARRLNVQGTGLGLAVCKDLTNANGGDLIPGKSETLGGFKITLKWAIGA